MVKISFLGDIMCEKPFVKAARRGRTYDFSDFLKPCKELFGNSNYIIGNIETPCDPLSGVTKEMFVFNAPKEFLLALKEAGIDHLTTATNHCLDRGLDGLKNSIKVMDDIGMEHTGTFATPSEKKYHVKKFSDGTKVAILSFTYGTNYLDNKVLISENEFYAVNYLTPLYSGRNKGYDEMSYSLRARATRLIPRGLRISLNNILGRPSNISFVDKIQDGDVSDERMKEIKEIIRMARCESDLLVVCPHFGGQFNTEPGSYVRTYTDFFQNNNIDLMIGNHPHLAQKIHKTESGMIAAYSLGNLSISLSTPYVVKKDLPDYSIMLHVYIDNKEIVKTSFSILVECEKKGYIMVYPLKMLYEKSSQHEKNNLMENGRIIYNRVLGKYERTIPMLDEYSLEG